MFESRWVRHLHRIVATFPNTTLHNGNNSRNHMRCAALALTIIPISFSFAGCTPQAPSQLTLRTKFQIMKGKMHWKRPMSLLPLPWRIAKREVEHGLKRATSVLSPISPKKRNERLEEETGQSRFLHVMCDRFRGAQSNN